MLTLNMAWMPLFHNPGQFPKCLAVKALQGYIRGLPRDTQRSLQLYKLMFLVVYRLRQIVLTSLNQLCLQYLFYADIGQLHCLKWNIKFDSKVLCQECNFVDWRSVGWICGNLTIRSKDQSERALNSVQQICDCVLIVKLGLSFYAFFAGFGSA